MASIFVPLGVFLSFFIMILILYWWSTKRRKMEERINSTNDMSQIFYIGHLTVGVPQSPNSESSERITRNEMLQLDVDNLSQRSFPPPYSNFYDVDEKPPPSYEECVFVI